MFKMASGVESGELTNKQMVRLAAAISTDNLAVIAEGYMDISDEMIKTLRFKDNHMAFTKEIITHWANQNPQNQIRVNSSFFVLLQTHCVPDMNKITVLRFTKYVGVIFSVI